MTKAVFILFLILIALNTVLPFSIFSKSILTSTTQTALHLKNAGGKLSHYLDWTSDERAMKTTSKAFHDSKSLNELHSLQASAMSIDTLKGIAESNPLLASQVALKTFHNDLQYRMSQELYIIQFSERVKERIHKELKERFSLKLEHYVPENAFLVVLPWDLVEKIQLLPSVLRIIPFTKEAKMGSYSLSPISHLQSLTIDDSSFQKTSIKDINGNPAFPEATSSNKIPKALHTLWMPPLEEDGKSSTDALRFAQNTWISSIYSSIEDDLEGDFLHHSFESLNRIVFSSSNSRILNQIASLAVDHSYVYWVEIADQRYESELKYTTPLSKTGGEVDTLFASRGLTGKNIKIGIADSGVDTNSCFFHDPETPAPFIQSMSEQESTTSHRKIVSYWSLVDGVDEVDGHGSHVASIALGKTNYNPLNEFNGVAEDARLVFADVGCSTVGGCRCHDVEGCPCALLHNATCPQSAGGLYLPNSFDKYILGYHKSRGCKISSFSIGNPSAIMEGYTSISVGIDKFAYDNDYLIIFSAGNSGQNEGFSTITGPYKEGKNSLVVGAESSSNNAYLYQSSRLNYNQLAQSVANMIYIDQLCDLKLKNATLDELPECSIPLNIYFSATPESTCCEYLDNCRKSIIDFFQQVYYPFSRLEDQLDRTCCKACVDKYISDGAMAWGKGSLATFSSIGPAVDGRIKPDVVGIGQRVMASNSAHGTCTSTKAANIDLNIRSSSGTSMATPAVAGLAAIVYQYFEEGYYPGGQPSFKKVNPSASLVKAILIESARPLPNILRASVKRIIPAQSMSFYQRMYYHGHGSVNLQNVLKLKDADQKFNLYVSDRLTLQTGEQHVYKFLMPKTLKYSQLSATLVWTDPPGVAVSSFSLVNNLDLFIETTDSEGKIMRFNGNSDAMNDFRADQLNNVEKRAITVTPGREYRIYIRGMNVVTTNGQSYSLVVTHGSEDEVILEKSNFVENINVAAFIYLGITVVVLIFLCICLCIGLVCLASIGNIILILNNRTTSRSNSEVYKTLVDREML